MTSSSYIYGYFFTILVAILAISLTVVPIPQQLIWVWPQWLLILVLYLVFTRPAKYGIYFGFFLGLLTDVIVGNILGLHALTYTVFAYFLSKMNQRIAFFHTIQQILLFFALIAIDRCLALLFSGMGISYIFIVYLLSSSIVSLLVLLIFSRLFGSRAQLLKFVR